MNRSAQRFVLVLATTSVLVACAASDRAARPGVVTTTSATVQGNQCKASLSNCFHNRDCCSDYCDYDQYFCH